MGNLAPDLEFDLNGFLDWEGRQDERFERLDGVVRMMSGGTSGHDLIAANLIAALRPRLRGGPCVVQGSNLKIVARAAGAVMYPTCSFGAAGWRRLRPAARRPSSSSRFFRPRPPSAI